MGQKIQKERDTKKLEKDELSALMYRDGFSFLLFDSACLPLGQVGCASQ